MRSIFTFILFLVVTISYSQTSFKEGYVIDNKGNLISCYLRKTYNTLNSPYKVKFDLDGEAHGLDVELISEYGIEGEVKYSRHFVRVDVSEDRIYDLKDTLNHAEYYEGHVFLQNLIETEQFSLNYFFFQGKEYFFYNKDNGEVHLLINKRYEITKDLMDVISIMKDETYQKQLETEFPCSANTATVSYNRKAITNYFYSYLSETMGEADLEDAYELEYNLMASLLFNKLSYTFYEDRPALQIEYFKANTPGLGLETDLMLPFLKNAVGFFIAANYVYLIASDSVGTDLSNSDLSLHTLEFPIGIKGHIRINDKMSIYARTGVVSNYFFHSSSITHQKGTSNYVYDLNNSVGYFGGLGICYKRFAFDSSIYTYRNFTSDLSLGTMPSVFAEVSFRLSYKLID